jgi:lipopolysaccharide export system protein LptA
LNSGKAGAVGRSVQSPKRLLSKFRAFMKTPLTFALLLAALAGVAPFAFAEKADRNKPMNIEADLLRYDDLNQRSVFTGRVILTKGTIQIRGHQIEVRQDPEGFQYGWVTSTGNTLAFFRQKREGVDEFLQGEAVRIEYDGKADTVKFIGKARLLRLRGAVLADEITGGVILYENQVDRFSVDGTASNDATGAPKGRVRAMLTPKPAEDAPRVSPPAALPLRSTPALQDAPQ